MILAAVLVGLVLCVAGSLPWAYASERTRAERERERAAWAVERDWLVRTIVAATGDGPTTSRLRALRPEVGEPTNGREVLRRQADQAAQALAIFEEAAERKNGAEHIIPVGMGGE